MKTPLKICLVEYPQWEGGRAYIANIINALSTLPEEKKSAIELYLVSISNTEIGTYNKLWSSLKVYHYNPPPINKPRRLLNRLMREVLRSFYLNSHEDIIPSLYFLKKIKADFIFPHPYGPARADTPFRFASWIPDFQHKLLTSFFNDGDIKFRDNLFSSFARNSPIVVLSSRHAGADFKRLFPEESHKSRILSFRVYPHPDYYDGDPAQTQREYNLPDRFFFIGNQFWQHKNHMVVFNALRILRERSIYPVIVCSGGLFDYRRQEFLDSVFQMIHKSGISSQVFILGFLPKKDQVQLLRRSLAVIQPSFFEGWSTVVEEARIFGKPAILSNIGVHLEQNPPGSQYFDPNSPEELADILADSWSRLSPGPDKSREEEARKKGLEDMKEFGLQFLKIASEE